MPIGFKNGTGGSKKIAIDAICASRVPHSFLSVTSQGLAAIVETMGNVDCHIVLRGSDDTPNYSEVDIDETEILIAKHSVPNAILIDCSHGNSRKQHQNQLLVLEDVCQMIEKGRTSIIGVMLESNIVGGKQELRVEDGRGRAGLVYGQSVTDACISWEQTQTAIQRLVDSVNGRRQQRVE